jgi:hypothetical protein
MRAIAILLLLGAACYSVRPSPYFKGLSDDANGFVTRSAPQATWTTRLQTAAPGGTSYRLPGTQVVAFETDRTLDEAESKEFLDRVEFEVVRSLFSGKVTLVSRREATAQPGVRGVMWEYQADDRRGFIAFFGVHREPGYEVIFSVCEVG